MPTTDNVDFKVVNNGASQSIDAVISSNSSAFVSNVVDLLDTIKDSQGKEIWQSKVVWLNVISIMATAAAHFGFDFKAHGINEESLATLIITIVGIINLYLRKGTDTPLKTPSIKSVKSLVSPLSKGVTRLTKRVKK